MKALFLLIVILFVSFYSELTATGFCCESVTVSTEFTANCCIKINVYNPYCGDDILGVTTMYVKFTRWNSLTQSYDLVSYIPALIGTTVSEILCPEENENFIKYRVFICDQEGVPYCPALNQTFMEGYTMYTDSVSTSSCCQCPSSKSNWLKTTIYKSRSCLNEGCLVTLAELNIPPEDACYTKYQVKWGSDPLTPMKHLATDPIWQNSHCVPQGQNLIIYLYLYKEGDSDPATACRILRIMGCTEELPSIDTTTARCTPDCPGSTWHVPVWRNVEVPAGSGCQVNVLYTYRTACPPNNYQDLQVMEIKDNSGCASYLPIVGTTEAGKELYKQAVVGLVEADPIGFRPQWNNIGCDSLWRIVKTDCWRALYYLGPPTWTHPYGTPSVALLQCDTGGCCVQQYSVCRDASHHISMTPMGNISMSPSNPSCLAVWDPVLLVQTPIGPGFPIPINDSLLECHSTCDWVQITYDPMIVVPEKAAVEQNDISNESNDKITINCSSEQVCNLRIEYFDLLGNLVFKYRKTLQNTLNNLDISSLIEQNGIFVYRVYVNDLMVKSGKVIK